MTRTELNALMRGDRIVVLGAPTDVDNMLTLILDERRVTERYLRVVHICHSAFKGLDDLKARLNRVRRGSTPRYQFIEADPLDHEVLKKHVLAPGLYSVVVTTTTCAQRASIGRTRPSRPPRSIRCCSTAAQTARA
jgi:hypothetical protein